ncbi:MAG: hypothetical protein Q9201_000081 [Fulgogasparrea decipioides]
MEREFCPLGAVNKWPYKFLQQPDSETISKAFFAAGQFRSRGWTLYYINTLLGTARKPLILVPADEVQALFDDIKQELGLIVYFPSSKREPGFLLSFTEEGVPRPRYLGRLDFEHSLDEMEAKITSHHLAQDENHRLDDRSFAAFKKKMEAAVQATNQKSKNQRDKKKKDRVSSKHGWCEQLKRTQCYLGIRPRADPGLPDPVQDDDIPPRELEAAIKRYNLAQCINLPDLDVSQPAPFPFQSSVIFICVDVEAYEKEPRPITEIGISTLDTNDLVGLPPGERGMAWMKKIHSRHFRIQETSHLHNTDFVAGCADRFEPEFGVSEWILMKEAPQVIASCFRPPYSSRLDPIDDTSNVSDREDHGPKRQLILVGHDIKMDIDYLRKLGYDVSNLSNIIEALDTADLWRAWKHEQNPTKLGSILLELELVGWNLHNAGNDAAYTLQCLLGIAISARTSPRNPNSSQLTNRTQALEREARDRAKEEADEWAAADQEGGDGGPPKPLDRIGWPAEAEAEAKKRADKIKNDEAKRAERRALDMKELKAGIRKEDIKSEPWVADEVGGGEAGNKVDNDIGKAITGVGEEDNEGEVSFEQGITDRLALLEGEGAAVGGGVKLPAMGSNIRGW